MGFLRIKGWDMGWRNGVAGHGAWGCVEGVELTLANHHRRWKAIRLKGSLKYPRTGWRFDSVPGVTLSNLIINLW